MVEPTVLLAVEKRSERRHALLLRQYVNPCDLRLIPPRREAIAEAEAELDFLFTTEAHGSSGLEHY